MDVAWIWPRPSWSDAGELELSGCYRGPQWQPYHQPGWLNTFTTTVSLFAPMFFIQPFSAPKDNAAIHHTTFKLKLIKSILHFCCVFPALLAKNPQQSKIFQWAAAFLEEATWGQLQIFCILRYPCRLYCFICHQAITPSIVTTYDISCLARLPSGSLVLPGAVQHIPTPALWEAVSLSAGQTLSSIDSFIYLSLLCIE